MKSKNKGLIPSVLSFEWMKKFLTVLVFILTMLVVSLPLFHSEMFRTHDFVHGVRIAEMTQAFRDGHFPVRWSRNLGYGYGMPLFEFYAPLPYYVGSLWYWLSGNLVFSSKLLWFIPSLVGFIGTYLFVSRRLGRLAGVVAAVLFTVAPYRAVNLYVRGAISEAWAMSFLPWILYGVDHIFGQSYKKKWLIFILSMVGLILSHNLTTLFFLPFVLLYAATLVYQCSKIDWQKAVIFGLATLLSVGLTLFYTLPAVVEKNFTQVNERILTGYFHYSQHFLYIRQFLQENWLYGGSQWGPNDQISFFLGYGQWILFIVSVVLVSRLLIITFNKHRKKTQNLTEQLFQLSQEFAKRKILFFSVFGLFLFTSLFMSLQKSQFIWDSIELLQVAQFPWRFLSLASFFLAVLGSFTFYILHNQLLRYVLALIVMALCLGFGFKYFQPELYLDSAEALYYADPGRIQREMSETLPDYIPQSLPQNIHPADLRVEVVGLEEERDDREILVDRTHEMLVKTNFSSQRMLRFNIADFPGWTVTIDGERVKYNWVGSIEVAVPEGEHLVGVQLRSTPIRQISDIISLCSWLLFGYLLIEFRAQPS